MQKEVTVCTHDFAPGREGISNTIPLLLNHFSNHPKWNITLHDISRSHKLHFSQSYISYGLSFLPIGLFLTRFLQSRSDLMHILGSLTGRIYINLLKEGPILLTNSSAIDEARVDQCRKWWGKITRLIVECTRDQLRVLDYGFTPSKVSLVYPAVDLDRFSYHPPPDRFTIGFASSPISNDRLGIQKRGVDLLLSVAREFSDIQFVLLWRGKHLHQLRTLTQNIRESNVTIINKILPDMDKFYATVNCTILPATFMDDCKPCPNSIMESLSAGKPALVSDQVGIADLVSNSGSGLVFKPDRDHLIPTIYEMRNNYWKYQATARMTAERYFSVPTFLGAYTDIYNEMTQP